MTAHRVADEQARGRWIGVGCIAPGVVVLGAGLWASGQIALWYVLDDVADGVHLRDRSAVVLPAVVAVLVTLAGVASLVLRRRLTGAGGLVTRGAVALVGVAAAVLAVGAFPSIVGAKVIAIDPEGTRQWTTAVPLSVVGGVSAEADGRVTVYGTSTDHGCWQSFRRVTLDRATGHVLEVERNVGSDPAPGDTPRVDPKLEAHGLTTERGELPFVCS